MVWKNAAFSEVEKTLCLYLKIRKDFGDFWQDWQAGLAFFQIPRECTTECILKMYLDPPQFRDEPQFRAAAAAQ